MKYNIDQRIMTDDDIIDYFEFLVSYGKDIELEVKKSYNNLIFLGSSIDQSNENDLDAFLVNVEVCLYYFYGIEDYFKVQKLLELYQYVFSPNKIKIDRELLDNICLNLNFQNRLEGDR